MLSNEKWIYELWTLRLRPHSHLWHLSHHMLGESPTPDFIPCQPTSPTLQANQLLVVSHTHFKAVWPLAAASVQQYNTRRAILVILNQPSSAKMITGKPLVCTHTACALWHAEEVWEFSFAICLVWIVFPTSLSAMPAAEKFIRMWGRKYSAGNQYCLLFTFQQLDT